MRCGDFNGSEREFSLESRNEYEQQRGTGMGINAWEWEWMGMKNPSRRPQTCTLWPNYDGIHAVLVADNDIITTIIIII